MVTLETSTIEDACKAFRGTDSHS